VQTPRFAMVRDREAVGSWRWRMPTRIWTFDDPQAGPRETKAARIGVRPMNPSDIFAIQIVPRSGPGGQPTTRFQMWSLSSLPFLQRRSFPEDHGESWF
jgi:hypothetical protein